MILDRQNRFSAAQSLISGVAVVPSTDIIDLHLLTGIAWNPPSPLAAGQGIRDIGIGDSPALKIYAAIVSPGVGAGASLQALAQGAPDDGTGNPGTWVTYVSGGTVAVAGLIAGARLLDIDWPRPPAGVGLPRFIRLAYNITGAGLTGGTIDGYLVLDRQDQIVSAAGFQSGYVAGVAVPN
jgi:hypothetical protein